MERVIELVHKSYWNLQAPAFVICCSLWALHLPFPLRPTYSSLLQEEQGLWQKALTINDPNLTD